MNNTLPELGRALKVSRKAYRKVTGKAETVEKAASRIGVSRSTYLAMEKGLLSVSFGRYYAASLIYGGSEKFEHLFTEEEEASDLLAGWPGERDQ